MIAHAEFYHESTGYVAGSIPPRFEPSQVRLIPACGSDSVAPLDGRRSLDSHIETARGLAERRKFPAFVIRTGARYGEGRVVYKSPALA